MKLIWKIFSGLRWPVALIIGALCSQVFADALYQIGAWAPLIKPNFPTSNLVTVGGGTAGVNTQTPGRLLLSDYQTATGTVPALVMAWNGTGWAGIGADSVSTPGFQTISICNIGNNDPGTAPHACDATQTANFKVLHGQTVVAAYTVATLPTGIQGGLVHVTDQLTSCPALGSTFTGGGSVKCLAFFNGTSWVSP